MSHTSPKYRAAAAALAQVESGMRLGLGTGSTAACFVDLLGDKVAQGLDIVGVPTSQATRALAQSRNIPLTTLEEMPELDLTIDGADEIDPALRLIKGGGGALLWEKIVAASSRRMIVIADASKRVAQLGAFPLPVEVVSFGLASTRRRILEALTSLGLSGAVTLRTRDGKAFVTDSGHSILDCALGTIPAPELLAAQLAQIAGVVEHGLFIGLAKDAIIGEAERVVSMVSG